MDPVACCSDDAKVKELTKTIIQNEAGESNSSDYSGKPEDNISLWEDHHKLVHKAWKMAKSDVAF